MNETRLEATAAKKIAKKAARKILRHPAVLAPLAIVALVAAILVGVSTTSSPLGAGQTQRQTDAESAKTIVEASLVTETDLDAYAQASSQYGIPWQILAVLANEHGGTAISGGGATGELVEIPEPYGTGGFTVTLYGPQGWYMNNRWTPIAKGTGQEKVHDAWVASGAQYDDGIAVMDGRYLIACTSTYGHAGDLVTFQLADGTSIPAVIADEKNPNDANFNQWGHDLNVVEFEVDKDTFFQRGNPGTASWKSEWAGKRVVAGIRQGTHPLMNGNTNATNVIEQAAQRIANAVQDNAGENPDGTSKGTSGMTPLEWATRYEGYPYMHAEGPDGFDCSGLVNAAYKATLGFAVAPDRYPPQAGGSKAMAIYMTNANGHGQRFSWTSVDQLQPGDLLFHQGHIAFYAGNGKIFHAAGNQYTMDGGKHGIGFQNIYDKFRTMDAIRVDGSATSAMTAGTGASVPSTGGSIGLPSFTGGKGRFHLDGEGTPEDEALGVQAVHVAKLLGRTGPSAFAVDAKILDGKGVYLDENLKKDEDKVRAAWVKAIAALPIASMDETKAGLVYDAAKRWAMGDVTSAGAGTGETCVVTSWDTSVLDPGRGDLPVQVVDALDDPSPEAVALIKDALDATRETVPVMRQKGMVAALLQANEGGLDREEAEAIVKKAQGATGSSSSEVARELGGSAATGYMDAAEAIMQAVAGNSMTCTVGAGAVAGAGEVAVPFDVGAGMTFETCSTNLASTQVRGPRSCSICRYNYHYGEDYGTNCGVVYGTPQYAVIDGTVDSVAAGAVTYHGTVGGEQVWVVHCHMPQIDVRPGDRVTRGQRVGTTGIVGLESSGVGNAHAHIEIWPGHAPSYTHTSADGNGSVDTGKWIRDRLAAQAASSQPEAGSPKEYAHEKVLAAGWSEQDYQDLVKLWERESNWNPAARNASSGAYGIVQALPESKLADPAQCGGADYRTNWRTQIDWGLCYIKGRHGSPSGAWAHSQAKGWY